MTKVDLKQATLDACVLDAQRDRIIITRDGRPVALIIGVEGMDEEQLEMGSNGEFWRLIAERRGQPTVSRAQLEQRLRGAS